MSSPNEPGQSGTGDAAGTTGAPADRSASRPTAPVSRVTESGEVPPWQRGAARAQQAGASKHSAESPAEPVVRETRAEARAKAEARVSRYVTGSAAPAALQKAVSAETEAAAAAARAAEARAAAQVAAAEGQRSGDNPRPTDAALRKEYPSELPDLSGPVPRPRRDLEERAEGDAADNAETTRTGRIQVGTQARTGPVRASMQIRRIDPWSTLKVSLLLSVSLFFVWMIAVAFLYLVLGGMGVWSKLNSNVGDLLTSTSGSGAELVSAGTIFGGAFLIGLLNIVILTAMATIGAFIYNLSTDIVGGVEVTLADRE